MNYNKTYDKINDHLKKHQVYKKLVLEDGSLVTIWRLTINHYLVDTEEKFVHAKIRLTYGLDVKVTGFSRAKLNNYILWKSYAKSKENADIKLRESEIKAGIN